jgi:hypothetical protein
MSHCNKQGGYTGHVFATLVLDGRSLRPSARIKEKLRWGMGGESIVGPLSRDYGMLQKH